MSIESMLAVRYLPIVVSSRKKIAPEDIHLSHDVIRRIAMALRKHLRLGGIEDFNESGVSLILALSTSLIRVSMLSELVRKLVEVISRLRERIDEELRRYYVSSRILDEMLKVIDLGMSVDSACAVPPPRENTNAMPLVLVVGLGIISDGSKALSLLRIKVPGDVITMLRQEIMRFFSVNGQSPEIPLRVSIYNFICRLDEALMFLWREIKRALIST